MAEEGKETTYSYKAVDKTNHVVKGVLDARSEEHAIAKVKAKGLIPIQVVKGASAVGLDRDISIPGLRKRPKLTDLAIMSRQLSAMVDAGMPIIKALGIVESQMTNRMLQDAIHDVRMDVESGQSLADSMAKHDDVFPSLMVYMVKAGQEGGFLDQSLKSVANNFESDVKLKRQIKSAMAYPIVVLLIALLAVNGMIIFIVPAFSNMFKSMGGKLPALTEAMVVASKILPYVFPAFIIAIMVFMIWWRKNKNKERIRSKVDSIKLKLPVFGDLALKIALTRFTRNLSTMLKSAVPIIQALNIVGETSGNWVIEQASHRVAKSIRQGGSLGTALAQEPIFPVMVVQMVVAGEDSGATDTMLEKASEFYDSEVTATTAQLTSLLEPIMIVILGAIIGTLVIGLYLPMFTIFNQIQSSNNM